MNMRFLIAAALALMPAAGAVAGGLPTYESRGLPITPVQLAAIGPADAQERAPAATLTLTGMPASPHQIAVLTRRDRLAASGGEHPSRKHRPGT